jgi:GNAT superfamily N-acetyltransferase
MNRIERIPYNGELPESFFAISQHIYSALSYQADEDPASTTLLLQQKASTHDIILYTDHQDLRLVGIFPHEGEQAYFAYWETSKEVEKSRQAFSLLQADARAKAKTSISGPYHFNTFHRYRLRLDEPNWQVFDREPVNPVYYADLLAAIGFLPSLHFESRLIRSRDIPALYQDKQFFLKSLQQRPFSFIPLMPQHWQQFEQEIFELVQAIFSQNPGYRSVPEQEFRLLYNQDFAEKLCPYSSVLFQDTRTGRLAAMSFCHPNYSALNLGPGQAPVYARDFPKLKKKVMLAKSVGVHPDYRQQGLMSYLAAYAMQSFHALYDEALFCLMRSDNHSLQFTQGLPYEKARYALYRKDI